jgi:Cu2+-exporting ATPase
MTQNNEKECFHCGLPVPEGLDITVNYEKEARPMCCYGCQAVAQAIIDSGMDDYYRYRTSKAEKPGEMVPAFLQQLKAYDNDVLQKQFVEQADESNIREVSLILEGITCAACIWLNEKHLNSLDGVISANINYSNHRARVRWDNSRIHLSDILEAITRIGYMAHPYDPDQHQRILENERKQQLRRLGISGLLGMQIMIFAVALYTGDWWGMDEMFRQSFRWISLAITIPLLLFASSTFFQSAYRDLRHGRVGMDVPISLGIGIAFFASTLHTIQGTGEVYFDSVAMFTFFLLSARYFEAGTRKQTSEATEALLNLKPAIATRLIDYRSGAAAIDNTETIAVSELRVGDYILVRPGDTIAEDGIIEQGHSGINESLVTGESMPVSKSVGDEVIGGSTNTENPLVIRITKTGEDSVLSSIQRLIENAQHTKPAIARLADRIATWFVSGLLTIAAIIAWYWLQHDPDRWLEITIATLVVSCPCALSLATPTAITAASGQLARIGLMPKSSHALETLAHATDFVFDKTGTLTEGRIELERVELFTDDIGRETALTLAASLESRSEHPIAQALLQANTHPLLPVTDLQHLTGEGIYGTIAEGNAKTHAGQTCYIGHSSFIQRHCRCTIDESDNNNSTIYLATNDRLLAGFSLSDSIRREACDMTEQLKATARHLHLLSGDRIQNTRKISEQLNIEHYRAEQTPDDKLHYVKELQNQGAVVVMTGDGVNDAPVLAGADLSIAMGKGTQLAAATADMVLISNHIEHIAEGYRIATRTLRIIKQNLGWALGYNITAIPAAAMGYVEPWMAAIGMSASSLIVVLNAMRLSRAHNKT